MSSRILPLTLLILAIITPCLMAPIWTDDDNLPSFFNHINNNDDDYLNIFEPKIDYNNFDELFTPKGLFMFDDLFKTDDSNEDTISTNLNKNNEPPTDLEEIDPSVINQLYLNDLIKTISLIHRISEIVNGLHDDESIITNHNDDDDDDGITVIGKSNKNPNVDIKLTFDKFDDDNDDNKKDDDDDDKTAIHKLTFNKFDDDNDDNKKDDDDDDKTAIHKLTFDDINIDNDNNNNDNNKFDESDEVTTNKVYDEILKPEYKFPIEDSDEFNELLLTNQLTNKLNNNNVIKNNINKLTTTTTNRPTEWDESDEINEDNLKFVPVYDNSMMPSQPKYKIVY